METVEATVGRRSDEWIEIPTFRDDGEPSGVSLQFRPGNADERTEIRFGSLTLEVQSVGIERALRLVEQER
jgi:hypothetical protein